MKTYNYILASDKIHFLLETPSGSVRKTVNKSDYNYPEILAAMSDDDMGMEEFLELFDKKPEGSYQTGVTYSFEGVFYNGKKLPPALAEKVKKFRDEDLPFAPMEKFLERISKNPSYTSINELYDFLAAKELPITEDGCFIAYKGISSDGYSVSGNVDTVVKTGVVDSSGRILNTEFGKEIEVERDQVDDDRTNECSNGLHVGSPNYAFSFGSKTIKVKVDPADVVSVPKDHSFQKCRVSKYIPLDYVEREITYTGTDSWGEEAMSPQVSDWDSRRSSVVDDLEDYIFETESDLFTMGRISLKRYMIDNSIPKYEIIDALQELNADWEEENDVIYVYGIN